MTKRAESKPSDLNAARTRLRKATRDVEAADEQLAELAARRTALEAAYAAERTPEAWEAVEAVRRDEERVRVERAAAAKRAEAATEELGGAERAAKLARFDELRELASPAAVREALAPHVERFAAAYARLGDETAAITAAIAAQHALVDEALELAGELGLVPRLKRGSGLSVGSIEGSLAALGFQRVHKEFGVFAAAVTAHKAHPEAGAGPFLRACMDVALAAAGEATDRWQGIALDLLGVQLFGVRKRGIGDDEAITFALDGSLSERMQRFDEERRAKHARADRASRGRPSSAEYDYRAALERRGERDEDEADSRATPIATGRR